MAAAAGVSNIKECSVLVRQGVSGTLFATLPFLETSTIGDLRDTIAKMKDVARDRIRIVISCKEIVDDKIVLAQFGEDFFKERLISVHLVVRLAPSLSNSSLSTKSVSDITQG